MTAALLELDRLVVDIAVRTNVAVGYCRCDSFLRSEALTKVFGHCPVGMNQLHGVRQQGESGRMIPRQLMVQLR